MQVTRIYLTICLSARNGSCSLIGVDNLKSYHRRDIMCDFVFSSVSWKTDLDSSSRRIAITLIKLIQFRLFSIPSLAPVPLSLSLSLSLCPSLIFHSRPVFTTVQLARARLVPLVKDSSRKNLPTRAHAVLLARSTRIKSLL